MEILFVLVPDTPVLVNTCSTDHTSLLAKESPPASSRWCCLSGASWGDAMVPLLLQYAWKTQPLLLSHEMVPRTSFWLSKHNGLVAGVISCSKPLDNNTTEEKRMSPHLSSRCLPALPRSLGQDASPSRERWGREGVRELPTCCIQGTCSRDSSSHRARSDKRCSRLQWVHCISSGFISIPHRLSFRGAAFLVVTSSCATLAKGNGTFFHAAMVGFLLFLKKP